MLIKHQALAMQLNKIAPIYILTGPDIYLMEDAANQIKQSYKQSVDYEEQKINIQTTDDWQFCFEAANSYALFSENTLIDAYYDKKTLDVAGKALLNSYLKSVNPRSLILIRALELPSKQLQAYVSHQKIVIVVASPLDAGAMRNWIIKQLKIKKLAFRPQVPEIIQKYSEGNMLACAQAIEKLALIASPNSPLTAEELLKQLNDQSQYQLFDLNAACLQADAVKAIAILRQANEARVEPTLILWTLSNEIRLLLQLQHKIQMKINFSEACSQLKIWSSRVPAYQKMMHRLSLADLQQLLKTCYLIDEQIKSSQTLKIWQNFESISLKLCLGS